MARFKRPARITVPLWTLLVPPVLLVLFMLGEPAKGLLIPLERYAVSDNKEE